MTAPPAISLADVPGAPPPGTRLCAISDLGPLEARAFTFKDGHQRFDMFVQRWGEEIVAYKNSCPHVRLPLDFKPGRFLDRDDKYLLCANHGALFTVEEGRCVKGPCKGKYLTPVRIERSGDDILVG